MCLLYTNCINLINNSKTLTFKPMKLYLITQSGLKTFRLFSFLFTVVSYAIAPAVFSQDVNNLKLKDYQPVSIYRVPVTKIEKAKYPVTDFHSHDYPKTNAEVAEWVKTMDETGIAKSIILTYSTGARFDSAIARYAPYKDRFEVWCGFDYTGYD